MDMLTVVLLALIFIGAIFIFMGVHIVPQSNEYVVERLGKYDRTLKAGFNFIIPLLNSVAHKVEVLERQINDQPEKISVITKD
ncbi:MAG: hypothetical protein FJY56_17920 [Betaproteobacteria bacterium]|nr:hypothetical protein [Betaproteobacteria bacterium]